MNEDKDKALIGLKIAQETIEIMNDAKIEKSIDDFPYLLGSYNLDPDYYSKMSSAEYLSAQISQAQKTHYSSDRLLQKIERNDARYRRLRLLKIGSSIAAAVCVVFFLTFAMQNKINNDLVISNSYSGLQKPTLILANGNKIDLQDNHTTVTSVKKSTSSDNVKMIPQHQSTNVIKESIEWNHIIIPSKFNHNITLSDGTSVYLNAGTKLSYPTKFMGDYREVMLEGEAFFKVQKSDIPFIVRTKDTQVKVYGTEFNVNTTSYGITEALLIEGRVGVTVNGDNEVVLSPNDLFMMDNINGTKTITKVKPDNYISWLDNNFDFERINLKVFLEKISNWYGITFTCSNQQIENIYIDICTNRDSPVNELLLTIEKITNLQFAKESETKYSVK